MLANSRLSRWTLDFAWNTSDLSRSGSYLEELAVEQVELTERILHDQIKHVHLISPTLLVFSLRCHIRDLT